MVGPAPHRCEPRRSSVAVGHRNAGPIPQIMPPLVGVLGERKKLCVVSPSPKWFPGGRRLLPIVDRQDPSNDEIPFFVQFDWNDRLNIERVAVCLPRIEAAIIILLEWHADKARDRIGKLLCEIFFAALREDGGLDNAERKPSNRMLASCLQLPRHSRSKNSRSWHKLPRKSSSKLSD
jgi:hypothetical protein